MYRNLYHVKIPIRGRLRKLLIMYVIRACMGKLTDRFISQPSRHNLEPNIPHVVSPTPSSHPPIFQSNLSLSRKSSQPFYTATGTRRTCAQLLGIPLSAKKNSQKSCGTPCHQSQAARFPKIESIKISSGGPLLSDKSN